MPPNHVLYAAPMLAAVAGALVLLAGQPRLVPLIVLVAIVCMAGWFALAFRFQRTLLAVATAGDAPPSGEPANSMARAQPHPG